MKYDPESFDLSLFFKKVEKKKIKEEKKNGKRNSKRGSGKNHTNKWS